MTYPRLGTRVVRVVGFDLVGALSSAVGGCQVAQRRLSMAVAVLGVPATERYVGVALRAERVDSGVPIADAAAE